MVTRDLGYIPGGTPELCFRLPARGRACIPQGGWEFRFLMLVRSAYRIITRTPGGNVRKALLGFFLYFSEDALHTFLHGAHLFIGLYQIVCQSNS